MTLEQALAVIAYYQRNPWPTSAVPGVLQEARDVVTADAMQTIASWPANREA